MPFLVGTFCTYYTGFSSARPQVQDTYHAGKLVKALKRDRQFNGWAEIPDRVPGPATRRHRLDEANRAEAMGWVAQWIADLLNNRNPTGRATWTLVPVPGSNSVDRTSIKECTAYRLCSAIEARVPTAFVETCLHFSQPVASAHSASGSRDPNVLYRQLTFTPPARQSPNVVLVDDVYTTGGHLRASEAHLRRNGIKLWAALCAARTRDEEEDEPFRLVFEPQDEYEYEP